VFADKVGLVFGQTETFVLHLAALCIVIPFTLIGSFVLYAVCHAIIPLRVSELEERQGLDISQHGESLGEWQAPEHIERARLRAV
jgi:Amt family ammonium transporter